MKSLDENCSNEKCGLTDYGNARHWSVMQVMEVIKQSVSQEVNMFHSWMALIWSNNVIKHSFG